MSPSVDVSVCVPTYEGAAYLDACMASIAAQDLDGVEVVVTDDCSTDATVEIASSYGDRIPRLRVVRNDVRLGAVANLNRSIELARGRWIKPVFQDDTIEPGCLSTMWAARRRGVPVVVCARNYLYEGGVPEWRRAACDHLLDQALDARFGGGFVEGDRIAEVAVELAAQRVPHLNFVGEPIAILLDRTAVRRAGAFDTRYVQLWDYELVLRLAMKRGLVVVPERLANFRVHEESETTRNFAGSAFRANVLDRLRLHVAYATGAPYRAARAAAARHDPPIDLTALAVGVANAGRTLVGELPADEQPAVVPALDELTAALPRGHAARWAGSSAAADAATALLCELSVDPPVVVAAAAGPAPEAEAPAPPLPPPPASEAPGIAAVAASFDRWWAPVLGPLVGLAYLQLGWRQAMPGDGIDRFVALLASLVALAAYADLVGRRRARASLFAAAFAVLGVLPWLWTELDGPALALLAGLYVLPLLGAAPPLRVARHRLLGPVLHAGTAAVVPSVFTVAVFAQLGDATGPPALMVAGALLWSIGAGLRTALIDHGTAGAARVLGTVLFPLELAGLALLAATVATWSWGTVAVALVWVVAFNGARLRGVIDRGLATTTVDAGWFLHWYQIWPALLLSLALAVWEPWYLVLTGLAAVLFWPRLRSGLVVLGREARRELRAR